MSFRSNAQSYMQRGYGKHEIQQLRLEGSTILAICDDTQSRLQALGEILDDEPLIALASSGLSLNAISEEVAFLSPDVLLLAYSSLTSDAYRQLKTLKLQSSSMKVICSQVPAEGGVARALFSNNMDALLGQDASSGEYSVAIRAVGFGGFYVSRDIAAAMALSELPPNPKHAEPNKANPSQTDQQPEESGPQSDLQKEYGLSNREVEVLHLVAKGLSSKQVAPMIGISARTVEAHRANIKRKTSARGLSDLFDISSRIRTYDLKKGAVETVFNTN